jgi:hypothetical protein
VKKEVELAMADPEVSLSTLTEHVYVDNAKRTPINIQITSVANFTRSRSSPRARSIDCPTPIFHIQPATSIYNQFHTSDVVDSVELLPLLWLLSSQIFLFLSASIALRLLLFK